MSLVVGEDGGGFGIRSAGDRVILTEPSFRENSERIGADLTARNVLEEMDRYLAAVTPVASPGPPDALPTH